MRYQDIDLEAGMVATAIPPIEENMVLFPAGALTFGVEYRWLTTEAALASFALNQEAGRHLADNIDEFTEDDAEGPSIHVFDTEKRGEYLRFDCFNHKPHFHYIDPLVPWVNRMDFHVEEHGEMLDWVLRQLRSDLRGLLSKTEGGKVLAEKVDYDLAIKVLDEVEAAARMPKPAPAAS